MTAAPAPRVPQARLNAGPYPVRVAAALQKLTGTADGLTAPVSERVTVQTGTAYADRLDLPRERWAVRHYRRAVMAGAGVYAAGLWARLQPGRSAQVLDLDLPAVPQNDAGTFARIAQAARFKVRHSVRWRMSFKRKWREYARVFMNLPLGYCGDHTDEYLELCEKRSESKFARRRFRKAFIPACEEEVLAKEVGRAFRTGRYWASDQAEPVAEASVRFKEYVCQALVEGEPGPEAKLKIDDVLAVFSKVVAHAFSTGRRRAVTILFRMLRECQAELKSKAFGPILDRLQAQGDKYRAHLTRLSREHREPVEQQPPPLYCLPRPPAAPQAPPALQ